ncbi:MAG: DNA-binding response regulator [Caulobacteraceae bacterium]|nr:DNA-binding response regulator [Caulobacteraceae bacterium]
MNILLVDDHAIVRAGLRRLLSQGDDRIEEAASAAEAIEALAQGRFNLIILDLNLTDLGGLELLRRIRRDNLTPVLVLSMHAEALYASRALEAGARGYVSKNASPEELVAAVSAVAGGGHYIERGIAEAIVLQSSEASGGLGRLSGRDLEIMRLLAAGRSLSEIAAGLGLGYKTVANALTAIKGRLGVSRTTDLVRLAIEFGVS